MTAITLLPHGAPREAWLDLRRAGIGGSDIGALLGTSPFKTPFDLWRALTIAVEGINQALAGVNVFAADTILTAVADELGCDLGGIE